MDRAEQRFEWLLKQRGYCFWREDELHEVIPLRRKRPDYFVRTPQGEEALVEVESFEKPTPLQFSRQAMALSIERIDRRIRTAVGHAAQQLAPYANLGKPMVVILDNWRQVEISSDVWDLSGALFTPYKSRPLLNKKDKRYISAVGWNIPKCRGLRDRMVKPRAMYVRIIHNPFASVPLPRSVFNGRHDEHHRIQRNGLPARF